MNSRYREGCIEVPAGNDAFYGYLALPEGPGPYQALVLAPGVPRLARSVRALAARWAEEGFVTIALDLGAQSFARSSTDASMRDPIARFASERCVLERIHGAAAYLASFDDVCPEAVAVMGYGASAMHAWIAACGSTRIAACVTWCAEPADDGREKEAGALNALTPAALSSGTASTASPGCPHLALIGDRQRRALAYFLRVVDATAGNHQRLSLHSCAGAGEAFYDETRPESYRPEAARQAWAAAVSFLRENLP